jgi:hypothetical protein
MFCFGSPDPELAAVAAAAEAAASSAFMSLFSVAAGSDFDDPDASICADIMFTFERLTIFLKNCRIKIINFQH